MTDGLSIDEALTSGERELLQAFLHANRMAIAGLLDGLAEGQARRRLVPSLTTLLGLVKHAAFVERVWFDEAFLGRSRAEIGIPRTVDASFTLSEGDTVATVLEDHRQACARADEIAGTYALDDLALHNRRGPLSLRWVYVHLIEELARHAGHGDILREQILAADGAR